MIKIDRYLERVQTVLGGNVAVTQEVLDLPEYSLMAENFIIKYVPDYDSFIGNQKVTFESCVVYQTAINLFDYVQENTMKSEQSAYIKTERFEIDLKEKLARLIDRRDELLSELSSEYKDSTEYTPYGFVLSPEYVNPNSML